jgi:flagellar motor protein MotB
MKTTATILAAILAYIAAPLAYPLLFALRRMEKAVQKKAYQNQIDRERARQRQAIAECQWTEANRDLEAHKKNHGTCCPTVERKPLVAELQRAAEAVRRECTASYALDRAKQALAQKSQETAAYIEALERIIHPALLELPHSQMSQRETQ